MRFIRIYERIKTIIKVIKSKLELGNIIGGSVTKEGNEGLSLYSFFTQTLT